jgi:hypothetical protein
LPGIILAMWVGSKCSCGAGVTGRYEHGQARLLRSSHFSLWFSTCLAADEIPVHFL